MRETMFNKILCLAVIAGLSGCSTLSGQYELQAYNANGQVDTGLRMLTTGPGLSRSKNMLCNISPQARLKVMNTATGAEVPSEARNCGGKANVISFTPPETFDFDGQKYKLAHQQSAGNKSRFEYTVANENIQNWQQLITLDYSKNTKLTPEQWKAAQMQSLKQQGAYQNVVFATEGQVSYFSVTYLPVDTKLPNPMLSMYEVNVQKSFFQCTDFISLAAAQRFSATTKNLASVLKQTTDKLKLELQQNTWQPNCR